MGLSVEIAERLADANLDAGSKSPIMDAYMAKKRADARIVKGTVTTSAPVVKASKPVADVPVRVTKDTTWIVGERFQDRWGMTWTVTACEPGHVWAKSGILAPAKRFKRSLIVGCVKEGRVIGRIAGQGRPQDRSVGYKSKVSYDEPTPRYYELRADNRSYEYDGRPESDILKRGGKWPNNVNRDFDGTKGR